MLILTLVWEKTKVHYHFALYRVCHSILLSRNVLSLTRATLGEKPSNDKAGIVGCDSITSFQTQDTRRPERRLSLLFIAVGSIFAFVATVLGALMLSGLSGLDMPINLKLFSDHPYLQIFGFLAEFVCGVGYSIIPLFKSKKISNLKVAYIPFSLITAANVLGILGVTEAGAYYVQLVQVSSFLILVSSTIFCYQILQVLGRPSKILGEAEPFLSMAALSFVLISVIFLVNSAFPKYLGAGNGDLFSAGFIYLSLAGFTGSMIFGVQLRTIAFRMTSYRKRTVKVATFLQAVSILLAFFSTFRGLGFLGSVTSVAFLSSACCFSFAIRIFEGRASSRMLLPLTEGRTNVASHNTISDYTDACISSSMLWLLFSFVLGVLWEVFGVSDFAVRDSFIHSIAIGFIGSAIIAYGVVLLPGVLNQRAPRKHLSLLPLLLLNVGLIVRDGGNFYSALSSGSLPIWESLSGLFIIAAMIVFFNNIHLRGNGKPQQPVRLT